MGTRRMRPFNTCATFVIEYDKSNRKVTPCRLRTEVVEPRYLALFLNFPKEGMGAAGQSEARATLHFVSLLSYMLCKCIHLLSDSSSTQLY